MDIDPIRNLSQSMAEMGQMLTQMTEAKMALDDKMLRVELAETGESVAAGRIDTYA